jgi:hypothetical protein
VSRKIWQPCSNVEHALEAFFRKVFQTKRTQFGILATSYKRVVDSKFSLLNQGCQISKQEKSTKLPKKYAFQMDTNYRYLMAIKITKGHDIYKNFPFQGLKMFQSSDFWYGNLPSGNPVVNPESHTFEAADSRLSF